MTATTATGRDSVFSGASLGRLPGFGGLARKELTEWRRSRRTWVVLIVSTLFMALTALNAWLQANLPDEVAGPVDPITDPRLILLGAASSQIFVVAAVFAVMNLLVGERDSGTLAWTASKPVSRGAIWLAKFTVSTAVLWIAAGLVPLLLTTGLVWALYGPVSLLLVGSMALGIGLATALYVAITLAAGTIVPSQAAVAAIGLATMFLPQMLGLVVPAAVLPTSILEWSILVGVGEPAPIATPIAWAVAVVALVAFAVRRMERLEL